MNKDKESDLDEIIEMFGVSLDIFVLSLERQTEQMFLLKEMNSSLRYLKRSMMGLQVSVFFGILVIFATWNGL
jgi:hypothetical protein